MRCGAMKFGNEPEHLMHDIMSITEACRHCSHDGSLDEHAGKNVMRGMCESSLSSQLTQDVRRAGSRRNLGKPFLNRLQGCNKGRRGVGYALEPAFLGEDVVDNDVSFYKCQLSKPKPYDYNSTVCCHSKQLFLSLPVPLCASGHTGWAENSRGTPQPPGRCAGVQRRHSCPEDLQPRSPGSPEAV
eukprot:6184937-Pleurochrysis_carterae.AAC.1